MLHGDAMRRRTQYGDSVSPVPEPQIDCRVRAQRLRAHRDATCWACYLWRCGAAYASDRGRRVAAVSMKMEARVVLRYLDERTRVAAAMTPHSNLGLCVSSQVLGRVVILQPSGEGLVVM